MLQRRVGRVGIQNKSALLNPGRLLKLLLICWVFSRVCRLCGYGLTKNSFRTRLLHVGVTRGRWVGTQQEPVPLAWAVFRGYMGGIGSSLILGVLLVSWQGSGRVLGLGVLVFFW